MVSHSPQYNVEGRTVNREQMASWQDPTAMQQQQTEAKFKEPPKSVPDVGMGQKKVQTTEPQAY
jgi:hypothetical protein